MATTVAATVATAMAAVAVMAAAVAATVATIAAVATAAAMAKGQCLAVTAHEGNANQGEEQSETKHNDTIHPQILQLLTGTVSENNLICRQRRLHHGGRRPNVATRPGFATHHILPTRSGSLL
jgi:hypothetical protein